MCSTGGFFFSSFNARLALTQAYEIHQTLRDPNIVVVCDNDNVFRNVRVRAAFRNFCFDQIFLPRNTPLYQVIEPTFAQVKAWVRRASLQRPLATHYQLLQEGFARITPQECRNYFRSLGYVV